MNGFDQTFSGRMHTNVVQRVDGSKAALEALDFQWRVAQERALPTTSLLTLGAFDDARAWKMIETHFDPATDELGLHFHGYQSPAFRDRFDTAEPGFWLLPRDMRARLIDEMMRRFEEQLGYAPVSVGCYILDAWTLRYIRENHPSVRVAITNCFEEGVKMYHGNNHNWMLFSDGGPWAPFWPSLENALVPAASRDESIGIIALPHLNRDMIMALNSRDDLFASHPGNLVRARINEGASCPYMHRFVEAWVRQAEYNGWSYLSLFVSSPWLHDNHWIHKTADDTRSLYLDLLDQLVDLQVEDRNINQTLAGFADDFDAMHKPGDATLCHWKDELQQSKREIVWLANTHCRAAFDMNIGGTLCDFRPYAGRLNGDLGPETRCQWNGNYPFLVSAELRGGHWMTNQTAAIHIGDRSATLADRRVRATAETLSPGCWRVRAEPLSLDVGEVNIVVQSEWILDASPVIRITRRILSCSDPDAELVLSESFSGAWGTTEYPEDLRSVHLWAESEDGSRETLRYAHQSRAIQCPQARSVGANIEAGRVTIALEAVGAPCEGRIIEGVLFKPIYTFQLRRPVRVGAVEEVHLTCKSL